MKKFIISSLLSLLVLPVMAQRASDADVSSWGDNDWSHSGFFGEVVLGGQVGDVDGDFGVGFNLGYRWHIWNGLCWDVLNAGLNAGVSHFTETLDARFLSGIRYNTPQFVAGKSLYINCAFGYHFLTDETDIDGFAYEIGAGVNLNPHLSLGITWEANNSSEEYSYQVGRYWYTDKVDYNWGIIGLKLAYQF